MVPPPNPTHPEDGSVPASAGLIERTEEELGTHSYSENTRRNYLGHVRRYLEFADSEDPPPDQDDVRSYLHYLSEERKLSHRYVNQCAAALTFFYRHVCPGRLDPDSLPRLREERKLPVVLSQREVAALLDEVDSPRYRAILMLTYAAGLRTSEVIRLRPGDLDPERGLLHVPASDGRLSRDVMLSEVACRAIDAYRTLESSPRWLFPGARPGRHISGKPVRRAFHRARETAGVRKEVALRSLRHSFAVHLVERGIGLNHIQKFLGHARPSNTRVYLRVATTDPAAIRSPLDMMRDRLGLADPAAPR